MKKKLSREVCKTRLIKTMFAADCCFHMTIGLSLTFH